MTAGRWLLVGVVVAFVVGLVTAWGVNADRVAGLRRETARLRTQAVAWHRVALTIQGRVDSQRVALGRRERRVVRETDSVLVVLERERPDCAPVVAACERRLGEERRLAADWKQLLEDQKAAAAAFQVAADTAIAAADTATRAIEILVGERRSLWWRLLHPELRPGAFAGWCWRPDGSAGPCVGGGVTLSWRF